MRERGVNTALNYAILLGIVSILVSTLILGVGGLVSDQQERTVRSQLDVIGHRLASDLGTVDRLVQVGDGSRVQVTTDLPSQAVGTRYTITIVEPEENRYRLVLRSTDPDVVVRVTVASRTPIETGTVHGGTLVLEFDDSTAPDAVVVTRD